MLAAMYFFLRGTPFLYQGQELGMVNFERSSLDAFNDISSIDQYHRSLEEGFSEEEALQIINLRSRDNARTPFPWTGGRYGGFSETAPWLPMSREYPENSAKTQEGDRDSILEFYRSMIRFRQWGPWRDCLVYGAIRPLACSEHVIAYERRTEDTVIWCYFNFSGTGTVERLPGISAGCIWANDREAMDGVMFNGKTADKKTAGKETAGNRAGIEDGTLYLEPYQALLLKGSC